MSALLIEALRQLNLRPGQTHRVEVDGHPIEVSWPSDEVLEPTDQPMLLPWVEFPPTSVSRTLSITRGAPLLPSPFHLTESDLAPGDLPEPELD